MTPHISKFKQLTECFDIWQFDATGRDSGRWRVAGSGLHRGEKLA